MKICFHGAAQTVTGSKHLITLNNGKKILLDCGMYQGKMINHRDLNRHFAFDAKTVSCVFLSHAHIDHSGLLPRLVKEGFQGKIYATPATIDIASVLLMDSAHIQQQDVRFINKKRDRDGEKNLEPLYTDDDVKQTLEYFCPIEYGTPTAIDKDIELTFYDVGHIVGSATVFVRIKEEGKCTNIAFSGDVGRYGDPILRSPQPFPQVDYMIVESTYGNKLHGEIETYAGELKQHIHETCVKKGGKLIIPAFSVGRTQELLFALNELEIDNQLPPIPYYVDSPLSTSVTNIVKQHTECFNKSVQKLLKTDNDPFHFRGLKFITDKRESQTLNISKKPCVIISASGMAEVGRVKHHIANSVENPKNTILMIGYCEPSSLGARLKERPAEIGIFGERHTVKADIHIIDSMSAHADYNDLCQYLSCQDSKGINRVFVVHGEPEVQEEFKDRLLKKGFPDVVVPRLHEEFGLS